MGKHGIIFIVLIICHVLRETIVNIKPSNYSTVERISSSLKNFAKQLSILKEETIMKFLEKITGSDMTKEMKGFEARAKVLPAEFQSAWKEIMSNLWIHGDFTGRNLMPILDSALELLEVTSADGQSIEEVLGDDIKGFCAALVGDDGAKTYRDKWRDQLNKNVAKKLGGLK